jgi:hypothetical protein
MAVGLLDRPVATDSPGGESPRATTGIRGRLASLFRKPDPAEIERDRVLRLTEARALLERAREVIATGWVQDAFYVVRDYEGRLRPVSPFGLLLLSRTDIVGACLVGAVAHASSGSQRRTRRGPAAVAIDTLWDTLRERTGRWGMHPAAEATHPAARAARVRDLAHWNDEPQRTREDVLNLVDCAISRTILSSVR